MTQQPPSKPGSKDSSVLFSLKELMTLEEQRVQHELELERQAEAAILAREREEHARRVREDDERRAKEDEARRVAAQRAREEEARLEAIRHAEIERARLDAANAARLEELKREQAHQADLARLTQDRGKKRLRWLIAGTVALLVAVSVGGGLVIRAQAAHQRELEGRLASLESDRADLQAQADRATSPEERARLQAELDRKDQQIRDLQSQGATKPPPTATTAARPIPHPTATTTATQKPCVKDMDPLNPCL